MFDFLRIVAVGICVACLPLPHASAWQAKLDVSLAHPTLLAGNAQKTYLKVGLTGFKAEAVGRRPPINVALVLDKSGSMSGQKIEQAKNAAIRALDGMNRDDIVSVITYDSTVRVLVPSTKLTDKRAIRDAIRSIEAHGNTALFAGVSKGAAEVRKFLNRNRVNRVILLSDGLANVGPASPYALGQLGASLMKEGIAVSTLGLGLDYNEDLMVELARHSDGNHVFVEEATKLARVFDAEFEDAMSVVAQEVVIRIHCAPGIRPLRLLGINGEVNGQNVIVQLNQLYSEQEKYVLLEIEVPESVPTEVRPVADVNVSYANMATSTTDKLTNAISVKFDPSPAIVKMRTNVEVMTECVLQIANLRNELAVTLRDEGKDKEAERILQSNADYLMRQSVELDAEKLEKRGIDNRQQAQKLDSKSWKKTRKGMRHKQYEDTRQQKKRD